MEFLTLLENLQISKLLTKENFYEIRFHLNL